MCIVYPIVCARNVMAHRTYEPAHVVHRSLVGKAYDGTRGTEGKGAHLIILGHDGGKKNNILCCVNLFLCRKE